MTEMTKDQQDEVPSNGDEDQQARFPARRLWPVLLLISGFAAYFGLGLDQMMSFATLGEHRDALEALVADSPLLAAMMFFALYVLCVAFSLPAATLLTVTGGFLFGTLSGTVLVVLGATLGATAVFLVARSAFGEALRKRAGPALQKLEAGFQEDAFSYLLVLRLVPLFPFFLVNIGPAFLGIRLSTYVLTTLIGIIPGSLVYAGVGSGIGMILDQGGMPDLSIIFEPRVLLPILGLSLLAMVPVIFRRFRSLRTSPTG